MQGFGRERRELEFRTLHVAVKKHQPREVDRTIAAEDLILIEFKVDTQPLDDLRIGAGLNLQAHRIALASIVQLDANGLEQGARFFLLEVEV